ncbi:hypothetical protein HRG_005429 [Hirsutella rhossiliensis]|uniref:Uncharacterized protein n=1 Tax=Hirsutella rhossiliensis TaxID=111463 RepID=A0A9P8MXC7_9HYPO|nr:uncharacterized protein HRG_05429 [Hirsutella rhossiliensis]KAH0962919.1 hypothetical protein HRG_05429 [Hirsutella rhossiliensis]
MAGNIGIFCRPLRLWLQAKPPGCVRAEEVVSKLNPTQLRAPGLNLGRGALPSGGPAASRGALACEVPMAPGPRTDETRNQGGSRDGNGSAQGLIQEETMDDGARHPLQTSRHGNQDASTDTDIHP